MSDLIVVGQQAAADRATDDDAVESLQQAMAVISSVCDYAQELDAQGFNAADAWLGHVLAQMPPGLWSDSVALTAWDMLRKYRGQLAAAGIGYDQLPRPAGADELEADRREQARERARSHAQQWREQQYRQTHSYVRCDGDGEQVVLAFPYAPDLVAGCRRIDGRRYDGAAKTNVFPFTSLPAVIELATAHGIEVTTDVRALAVIAAGRAAEHAAQPQVRLDERDGVVIIDASLDAALYDKIRELGGRWDSAARVHRVAGHHAPVLASLAEQHGLRVSDQVRQFAADTSDRHAGNRAAAGAFEADPVPVPGLATGLTLKPQQYPVVRFALDHRRVLIGDDMGWGKTLSSLAAVAADGAYPVVVVCRPSLTLNWAAEIARFFPHLTVSHAQGVSPQPIPAAADVIIIGSAVLAAKPRKTRDGGKEFGWVEELAKAGPKALIIDEGQDTKERAANRSQACEQLAAPVIARDGLVLDLTGTAILNRPRELCQQLTILGRIGEFGGPKKFLWRYCLSQASQWGASYDGARNLIELHDRLRAWGIMIRRSDDTALGLPPCREHVLRIPQADLDPAVMNRYRQAEADLLGFLAGKARQAAARLGQDPDSAAVAAAVRASAAEHLVAINTLRQLAGQAKRGYVTGWVREHVQAGKKVMVAAHHRDEVDAYAAAFGGLKLQGGQPVAEKEAVKARFQQQPASQAPVIAVAIGAGGVGHTLTAAAIGIQAEQAWTPGETQQMKKRLHRIGQDREVDYYVTVAERTIDEHLQSVVTAKQATLDAVLDGRSDTGTATDERSVAAELTWRLTQQGLGTWAGEDPADDDLASPGPAAAPPDQQDTAPSAEWSWKWSGDLIKVYAGTGIAGRIYRAQGPRGTFYRAETASDPYRSLAVDREVARHLPSIDAAVEALRTDRDRGYQKPAGENRTDDGTYRQAAGQLPALAGQSGLRVTGQARTAIAARPVPADDHPAGEDTAPAVSVPAPSRDEEAPGQHTHGRHGMPVRASAGTGSRSGVPAPAASALGGICIVPGCGQAGRLYPAGTLCDTHRPGSPVPPPQACPECGLAVPAHAPGCAQRPASLWPAAGRPYGPADETTVRHWQQAHVDPDKVRAWCQDTGRDEPPASGALPPDLVAGYLAERGATDIPVPGGPARDRWLAQRPVLGESFTTQLGPLTVVYGPCPRCGHPTAADPGEPLPLCMECASGSGDHDRAAAPAGASGAPPRGAQPGGSSGQPGKPAMSSPDGDDDETSAQAQITGGQLREAAHRYLEDGLLPVPAWGANQNGECCCPRGAHCDRPGKHPRSVRTGPGPHDYSWKPLACRTHAEIDQRFTPDGEYAAGNLMVAIPEGMMAIDRDDDDGGRAALAQLAEELGELPPTLAHKTPHGEHLIYRTPPGWKGRAWVGKDPANPVPAGIDLRMPGQILMAAPSAVPGTDGPARYGPLTGDHVAPLPAAYVTVWTPPQPQPRPAGPRVPVPPEDADRAVRYVHEAMTRIAADLASRQPGGRNAAAYAAGLKAGSLLGAARATPGAEQAATAWTDEQAEEALMDAAERNGYTSKDGQAEALRAIRSGLRNGLRSPRALPDFTTTPSPATDQRQQAQRPALPGPLRPQRGRGAAAPGPRAGRWQDLVPDDIRRQVEAGDKAARHRRGAATAAHQQAVARHNQSATADTAAAVERTRAAAHAAHQAYTQDGRHITGRNDAAMLRWAASIIAEREQRTVSPAPGQRDTSRMQANRAAVAANEAYKAGDLDQARQLTDQAAALDPSRAGLWQQHRQQIAARRLILDARAAHTEGDHQRAQQILGQARQLDPRMPAIWDGDLPALLPARTAQHDRHVAARGPGGAGTGVRAVQEPGPQRGRPGPAADGDGGTPQPSWPSSPARRDPGPAATASQQAGETPPEGQRPAAATPPESRPHAHEATGDPDASTELPGNGPAPWPSPGLRSEPETAAPARQAGHEASTGGATAAEASGKPDPGARAAPSADWRDDIISAAREPWQPGPSWPDNPALRRPPDAGTPGAGIELGEPDA